MDVEAGYYTFLTKDNPRVFAIRFRPILQLFSILSIKDKLALPKPKSFPQYNWNITEVISSYVRLLGHNITSLSSTLSILPVSGNFFSAKTISY